jgi:hypothetical protein
LLGDARARRLFRSVPHQTDSGDPQTEYRGVVQERVMVNKEEGIASAAVQKRIEFKVFD